MLPFNFNVQIYKVLNQDLSFMNENQLISHYLNFGINEKRNYHFDLPEDFDAFEYQILNNDLSNLNEVELKRHYFLHGKEENRIYKNQNEEPEDLETNNQNKQYIDELLKYKLTETTNLQNNLLPSDFNTNMYRILNIDLNKLTDNELIEHYINFGKNENRKYRINNLEEDFNPMIYKYLHEDLISLNEIQLISHFINCGKAENREYKIELPQDFNLKMYRELNRDLYNKSDYELMVHYVKIGCKNNYFYKKKDYEIFKSKKTIKNIESELIFIKNHKNISYKTYNYNNSIENKKQLLSNIKIYVNSENKFWDDFEVEYFDKTDSEDSIFDNEVLLRRVIENNEHSNFLIINNKNISSDYLAYQKEKLQDFIQDLTNDLTHDFNIINCSTIDSRDSFYSKIESKLEVSYEEDKFNKFSYDCILTNKSTISKILLNKQSNNQIFNQIKTCILTRPYFKYEDNEDQQINYELSKTLWDTYYRVNSFWNKIYCVNLGFDIKKRKDMIRYCHLLNSTEKEFFYQGILGLNLPDVNTIINMGLINSNIIGKYTMRKGAIGLNITQKNILEEAIEKDYDYILLLEDDISFDLNFFETVDIFLNKYNDFDICYLGSSFYEEREEVLDKIDKINKTIIYKPKMDLLQKIRVCGCFAVLLSKKIIKLFLDRFKPINNISDVLLAEMAFDIKHDFSDTERVKTNYNLKTYFMLDNLFAVDTNKPSLTEENTFNSINNLIDNPSIKYLSKIKKINFKIKNNYPIYIYCAKFTLLYNKNIFDCILKIIPNSKQVYYYDNTVDIAFYCYEDRFKTIDSVINIFINGEKEVLYKESEIGIVTTSEDVYNYNIYFPFIWTSFWERRDNYKSIKNNTKINFCAYLYKKPIQYRIDLFHFISKYKKVDALGDCCNNDCNKIIDRYTYNENETYNDLAVQKYSSYKFVLALENGIFPGYSTEKLINPILAGSIPIYAGSDKIFEYINKKRVIYVYDFENYDMLLQYIRFVDNNDELYNSIVDNEIFCGDINFDNFEDNLKKQIKKAFGLEKRTIKITNEENDLIEKNIDMKIRNLSFPPSVQTNEDKKLYISDFINEEDEVIF